MRHLLVLLIGVLVIGMASQFWAGRSPLTAFGYGLGCCLLAAATVAWFMEPRPK